MKISVIRVHHNALTVLHRQHVLHVMRGITLIQKRGLVRLARRNVKHVIIILLVLHVMQMNSCFWMEPNACNNVQVVNGKTNKQIYVPFAHQIV